MKMSMILGLYTLLSFAAVGQTGRFTLGKNLLCSFLHAGKCIRTSADRGLCSFIQSTHAYSSIRRRLSSCT